MDGSDEIGTAMVRALISEGRKFTGSQIIMYEETGGRHGGEARISKIEFGPCSATLLFPFKGAI